MSERFRAKSLTPLIAPLIALLVAFTVELREVTYLFSHQNLIAIDLYRLQAGAIISLICIILLFSLFLHNRYLERGRVAVATDPTHEELADNLCQALDFAGTPISIHDADFTILKANQAIADRLGLRREEIVGRKCYEIFHSGQNLPTDCPQKKTIGSRKPEESLVEIPSMGGTMKIYCEPVLDRKGKVIRTIHVIRDLLEEIAIHPPAKIVQICTSCKAIRDKDDNWRPLEEHLSGEGILLSQGVCRECIDKLYKSCACPRPLPENDHPAQLRRLDLALANQTDTGHFKSSCRRPFQPEKR